LCRLYDPFRLSDSAKIFRIIHDWYPMPGLYLIYKDVYVVIQSMGVKDWDWFFIEADRLLFGVILPSGCRSILILS